MKEGLSEEQNAERESLKIYSQQSVAVYTKKPLHELDQEMFN